MARSHRRWWSGSKPERTASAERVARPRSRPRTRLLLVTLEDRLAPATLLHSLFQSGGQRDSSFGSAIAADTNFYVVGASSADVGGLTNVGQAFIYNASSGALIATLNNPTPANDEEFGASVAVSGTTVVVGSFAEQAYLFNATTGALVATLNNPTPASGDHFGSSVAVSDNTVVVGAYHNITGGTDAGSAYVFNATTFTLVATLNNPTPASGDDFGISVAVSGNTVVVGAFSDDTGAFNSGSAYVFDATTGGLVTTLNNPTPASSDWFGYSVAASGNSIVVGAYGDNTGATDAGSAYLFNAASGALIFTLNNPTPALQDWFGESVAVSGATVVVGARNANTAYVFNGTSGTLVATVNDPTPSSVEYFGETVAVSGNAAVVGDKGGAGSAYVFNATTGVLIATLNNPTQPYDERFGYSVAVSGNTVVVGAFLDAGYNGSAYVFNAATGALVVKLNDPTPEFDDEFGISVAVSGNVVVVGAWDDNTGASQSGAAYVFNATTGALVATLNNPTPAAGDTFGATVAVSGNTVVVGAQHDDTGATNAGSAYVFNATTGALIATINNPTPDADDEFGNSVAVSGNTVVVGAYQDLAGYAYVFDAGSGALIVTLNNPTPANGDRFGASVAVSGNTVVVGANSDNTGFPDSGSAYLFNATTGALIATLNNPTPANGDTFGDSVAVSGNTAVVGGSHDNTGTTAAGSAYVFNATTGALVDTMNNPTPASYDYFGYSVAVSGSTVVVGALWDDTFNTDQGAAYVYSIAAPTVQTVQVNDGSAQRSRVTSLTVRFDSQVTFTGAVANAFTFTRNGGVTVNFAAAASVVNGVTVVTIDSFTGTETQFGSLADGRYTLTALASQISANGQQMASDYHFGDAQGLFRIFGDVDGDQTVNGFDLGFFRNAFGTQTGDPNYLSYLDLNGDGVINGFDLGQFRTRFGTMLP